MQSKEPSLRRARRTLFFAGGRRFATRSTCCMLLILHGLVPRAAASSGVRTSGRLGSEPLWEDASRSPLFVQGGYTCDARHLTLLPAPRLLRRARSQASPANRDELPCGAT